MEISESILLHTQQVHLLMDMADHTAPLQALAAGGINPSRVSLLLTEELWLGSNRLLRVICTVTDSMPFDKPVLRKITLLEIVADQPSVFLFSFPGFLGGHILFMAIASLFRPDRK